MDVAELYAWPTVTYARLLVYIDSVVFPVLRVRPHQRERQDALQA
jgi:hypothetical protein